MMVAAISGPASTTNPQTPKITASQTRRPPLLPSEKDNNNGISNNQRKPKSIIVSSRYMSPSTSTSNSSSSSSSSRRFPSPLVSRNSSTVSNTPSLGLKRSVSADRRRPLTPDLDSKNGNNNNNKDVSAAAKLLITSTRSLSVSFQGEAFSLPVSKKKIAPPSPNVSSVRKGTPERRRTSTPLLDHAENSKPSDQHRWPARNRTVNPLARSLDCTGEGSKVMGSRNSILALQKSMIDERRVRPSFDGRLSVDLGPNRNSVNIVASLPLDRTASDSDSVSSGSTSGVHDCGGPSHGLIGPRGIAGSAKFWQETNSRLRRLQDPSSPLSPGSKIMPKLKRYTTTDGPLSSPRTMSSPIRGGGIRPASPSKLMTPGGASPSRGNSPSRVRNGVNTISNSFNGTPTVLGFGVDVWRGKVGENRIVDAHFLRLLYNRHVQWRFVNARTEAVLLVQKHKAEKNLWNVWITISDLRDTVTKKRHRLQLLKQKLKLASILKGQMAFLEDWAFLDKDHSISLLGAIGALKASTLRIPVVGGAIADVQILKDAIGSAVDVMRALASSICLLLPTIEEMNILASELSKVIAKERALLEQCTDFISLLAAMQVKGSSLRTHILQQRNRV